RRRDRRAEAERADPASPLQSAPRRRRPRHIALRQYRHASAKIVGSGEARRLGARRFLDPAQLRLQRAAFGAAVEMRRDRGGVAGVEFAVDVGLHQQPKLLVTIVVHAPPAFANRAKLRRARHSRDITVPIGTPAISAMARYGISSRSHNTTISRCSTGSAASRASSRARSSILLTAVSG